MSVSLNLSTASLDTHHGNIHSIPCKFTNTASVANVKIDEYFEGSIRKSIKDEKEVLSTSLRGRPLDGVSMELPSGYTGIVMVEPRKTFNEDEDRECHVAKQFKQFTYWNLDKAASESDKIAQAFDWVNMARLIHGPLPESDATEENESE